MKIIGEIAIKIDYDYEIKTDLTQYNRRFYIMDEQVDITRILNGKITELKNRVFQMKRGRILISFGNS